MPSSDGIDLVDRDRLLWDTSRESLLGEGSFGLVYRGKFNGTPVAIKVVKRPPSESNETEDYRVRVNAALKQHRREIHRFRMVRNPHIIQCVGVFRDPDPRDLYIVTEFLSGGSLYDNLNKMRARRAVLDESSFLQVALHIARGLNHVHSYHYTHGDMKPQNVLLTSPFRFHRDAGGNECASVAESTVVKIADFGLSKRLEGGESGALPNSTTATTDFGAGPCGTFLYMAPEAYHGVTNLSDREAKAADVYAYGLCLFELLSGITSWGMENVRSPMQLVIFVKEGRRPEWGPRKSYINDDYISFVEQCWSQDPEVRPTVDEIVNSLEEFKKEYETRSEPLDAFGSHNRASYNIGHDNRTPLMPHQRAPAHGRQSRPYPDSPAHVIAANGREDDDLDAEDVSGRVQKVKASDDNGNGVKVNSGDEVWDGGGGEKQDHKEDAQISGLTSENLSDDILGSPEENGTPTFVHVESMRRLTSQEQRLPYVQLGHRRMAVLNSERELDSGAVLDSGSEESSGSESEEEEEESEEEVENGERENGFPGAVKVESVENSDHLSRSYVNHNGDDRHEIDQSVIANVRVMKVDSVKINPPSVDGLSLPLGVNGQNLYGVGPVTPAEEPESGSDKRSNTALLNSFCKASLAPGDGAQGTDNEDTSVVTPPDNEDSDSGPPANDQLGAQQLDMNAILAVPARGSSTRPKEEVERPSPNLSSNPHTPGKEGTEGGSAHPQKKSYSSPAVEFDNETLSVFVGNDHRFLSDSLVKNSCGSAKTDDISHKPAGTNGLSRPDPGSSSQQPASAGAVPDRTPAVTPVYSDIQKPVSFDSVAQTASAPPLTDTSQSAVGGTPSSPAGVVPSSAISPSWQSPGSHYRPSEQQVLPAMNLSPVPGGPPGSFDVNAVLQAIARPDGDETLKTMWSLGHTRVVAAGLAQSSALAGRKMMRLTCFFLKQIPELDSALRDPVVAKDLCMTIGHIARNPTEKISRDTILLAIPTVLTVMPAFQRNVLQNLEVYSTSCFALCNLFKLYNVISDRSLRTNVACWIAYAISMNVSQHTGGAHGPFLDTLAYTATGAARNFMWMNEANVRAFMSCNYGHTRATYRLIYSMQYFDWAGRMSVVESSLSAVAMIIHFPRQRFEFVKRHGIKVLMDILHKQSGNTQLTALIFSMIAVLFAGPIHCHEELELLQKGFLKDRGSELLVSAVEKMWQTALLNERSFIEGLERGYSATLTVARFSARLKVSFIEAECMPKMLEAVRQLATSGATQCRERPDEELSRARGRLGMLLCELISLLGTEQQGFSFMRENNARRSLEEMLQYYRCEEGFEASCRRALSVLR